jgi:hypothetical protein
MLFKEEIAIAGKIVGATICFIFAPWNTFFCGFRRKGRLH